VGYIYIHVYTIWEEMACQPDSPAALETTSPKTSETYHHFAAALKTIQAHLCVLRELSGGLLYIGATGGGYK